MTVDEQVTELLRDYEEGHSSFQIAHFIVGAEGPTAWGMYQQALRELKKRQDMLVEIELDLDLARHGRRCWRRFDRVLGWLWVPWRIRAKRAARRYAGLIDTREDVRREFEEFLGHAEMLKRQLGKVDHAVLEAQRWRAKAVLLATVDLETHRILSPRTVDFMLNLPREMRQEVCHELGRRYQNAPKVLPSESQP
jgi:hypothetical protein